MPALDACEPQVLRALQKDGWTILNKPLLIRTSEHNVFADCLLERKNNGRNEQAIILEVKCFANPLNDLPEFYAAIGQYQFYQAALAVNQTAISVYLAIPSLAFERLTRDNALNFAIEHSSIKLVIIDIVTEEVVRWLH